MQARKLLWVGFSPSQADLAGSLNGLYAVTRVRYPLDICSAIERLLPWALCCEFDHLDAGGIRVLEAVRARFALLPLLLLAAERPPGAPKWFARSCNWPLLVKPCTPRMLHHSLDSLSATHEAPVVPAPLAVKPSTPDAGRIAPAVSYVNANFPEKIPLATAARMCDLSTFHFSRTFRKVNGVTFRDYVVGLRIQRAAELMKQSRASVTDAAFGVGFNDLSHFARMFRKQLGLSPSAYRAQITPTQLSLFREPRS